MKKRPYPKLTGLSNHQLKHKGTYRNCQTLEQCKAEYIKYWQFVAYEMSLLNGDQIRGRHVSELKEVA